MERNSEREAVFGIAGATRYNLFPRSLHHTKHAKSCLTIIFLKFPRSEKWKKKMYELAGKMNSFVFQLFQTDYPF